MIDYVIDAVESIQPVQIIVVLSPILNAKNDLLAHLQIAFGDRLGIAIQPETLGTGDALRYAVPLIHDAESVAVVFADHPLLESSSVTRLVESRFVADAALALLTSIHPDGAGYGRIARDQSGTITGIIERNDDTAADRSGPIEVNTGMMTIDVPWLRTAIGRLTPSPVSGQFYLTQLAELAVDDARTVTSVNGTLEDLAGVNDRVDLAAAETVLQARLRSTFQREGVTFVNGATTHIEHNVEIANDVTIDQGCILRSGTRIGRSSVIGPGSVLENAIIGTNCRVVSSFVVNSVLLDGSNVGPFSHIRSGSEIGPGVHIGNFSEIKNSTFAENVRMGHFSYVGDASIGARTNIGAGVVTCNFDGTSKHPSDVGEDVFLGSDTMLIAPVRIGDGAVTGAGSVVTRDVASGDRVAGVPARPLQDKHERSGN